MSAIVLVLNMTDAGRPRCVASLKGGLRHGLPRGKVPPTTPPAEIFNADREQTSRNDRAACRLPQRSDDERRRGADLSDDELSVPRYRARVEPVRAQGARQH